MRNEWKSTTRQSAKKRKLRKKIATRMQRHADLENKKIRSGKSYSINDMAWYY